MIYITRTCNACGGSVDIIEGEYLAISNAHDTMYFCKQCLHTNPTFRRMASNYVMEKAADLFAERTGNGEREAD